MNIFGFSSPSPLLRSPRPPPSTRDGRGSLVAQPLPLGDADSEAIAGSRPPRAQARARPPAPPVYCAIQSFVSHRRAAPAEAGPWPGGPSAPGLGSVALSAPQALPLGTLSLGHSTSLISNVLCNEIEALKDHRQYLINPTLSKELIANMQLRNWIRTLRSDPPRPLPPVLSVACLTPHSPASARSHPFPVLGPPRSPFCLSLSFGSARCLCTSSGTCWCRLSRQAAGRQRQAHAPCGLSDQLSAPGPSLWQRHRGLSQAVGQGEGCQESGQRERSSRTEQVCSSAAASAGVWEASLPPPSTCAPASLLLARASLPCFLPLRLHMHFSGSTSPCFPSVHTARQGDAGHWGDRRCQPLRWAWDPGPPGLRASHTPRALPPLRPGPGSGGRPEQGLRGPSTTSEPGPGSPPPKPGVGRSRRGLQAAKKSSRLPRVRKV
uniref:Uncharacterized protein n=1 Tax=Pipistrellus kuhlii TaxID=59472 RepID=A0A7J7WE22_PIPKU|nr:hypothetical protein mPipKuh1_008101 [Pipistrellus kuhlii]